MKVNNLRWDKLKMQWDILKMSSAYIQAESQIINSAAQGIDLTGYTTDNPNVTYTFEPMNPEDFFAKEVDGFGNLKNVDDKEEILKRARRVRKQLDEAIAEDNFEKAEILQNTLNILQKKYDKL